MGRWSGTPTGKPQSEPGEIGVRVRRGMVLVLGLLFDPAHHSQPDGAHLGAGLLPVHVSPLRTEDTCCQPLIGRMLGWD